MFLRMIREYRERKQAARDQVARETEAAARTAAASARYAKLLDGFLADGVLDAAEQSELDEALADEGLTRDQAKALHAAAAAGFVARISDDGRATDAELEMLDELVKGLGLALDDVGFDRRALGRCYNLARIDAGIPNLRPAIEGLALIPKPGEQFFWCEPCDVLKTARETVAYGGPVASVRIMRGLRYRIGTLQRVTRQYEVADDSGSLWFSTQRFGFEGQKKHFSLRYDQIHAFELTESGTIVVAKAGRQTAFRLQPENHEMPCAVISYMLNPPAAPIAEEEQGAAPVTAGMSFNLTNPEAVRAAEHDDMPTLALVPAEHRATVRAMLVEHMNGGKRPMIPIRELLVLTDADRAEIEAERATFPETLKPKQVESRVARLERTILTERAEEIIRTEVIRASVAGQNKLWREAHARGTFDDRATREWIATEDDRCCDACREMNGKRTTILGRFPDGSDGPPLHNNCRCCLVLSPE